jgi:hypothetical protein
MANELPSPQQDSYVQVATDGSGKKVDNSVLTREPTTQGGTGETVYRQRVILGSDENPRLQVEVQGEAGKGYAMVAVKDLDEMVEILSEIRDMIALHLGA